MTAIITKTSRYAICNSKLRIKPGNCTIAGESLIKITPSVSGKTTLYYQLQLLREKLPSVVIKGLPTVNRAIIHMDESKSGGQTYKLYSLAYLVVPNTEDQFSQPFLGI